MADPEYAIVDILCSPDQLDDLAAIPNLVIQAPPLYTDDPDVIQVHAIADAAAQEAAQDLGTTVDVLQSADEYAANLSDVFLAINEGDADGIV